MVQQLFEFVPKITIEIEENTTSTKKNFRSCRSANDRRIRGDKSEKQAILKTRRNLFLDKWLQICYNGPSKNGTEPEGGQMDPENRIEWFLPDRGYWRTGIYIRTIERGRRFGMIEIEPTGKLPKPRLFVKPDHVRPMIPIAH